MCKDVYKLDDKIQQYELRQCLYNQMSSSNIIPSAYYHGFISDLWSNMNHISRFNTGIMKNYNKYQVRSLDCSARYSENRYK